VEGITKTYPGVVALKDISIDFQEGKVHALVGENGAGKSTLIKTISGAIIPDSGKIRFDGKVYNYMTPHISRSLGIEVIYQEFNLVPALSVLENIFLGSFLGNGITLNYKKMQLETEKIFRKLQVDINPKTIINNLSVAQMQLVEIAKAISKDAKLLVMDEPTAPLTDNEVKVLMKLIGNLKDHGVTIIYISHRLSEVFNISDKVTVLRDGQKIKTKDTVDTTRNELISLMVGRKLNETFPRRSFKPDRFIMQIKNLKGRGVKGISFDIKHGEILGIAGLVGAGRTEMARLIFGSVKKEDGEIILDGKHIKVLNPKDAIKLGIGLVPEDRKQHGVILNLSILENITLLILQKISKFLVINKKKENKIVKRYIKSLGIKTPSLMQQVKNLSGGNQQKVCLSKWLASDLNILILDEPTRGIDVKAKQEIYYIINELSKKGITIIMISSEMEELLGMSDRIIVMCEGRINGILEKKDFCQEKILKLASSN
jgi:ribose transport system ATP-binding protein